MIIVPCCICGNDVDVTQAEIDQYGKDGIECDECIFGVEDFEDDSYFEFFDDEGDK